jgi:uncharacterized protein (DUF2147 family)
MSPLKRIAALSCACLSLNTLAAESDVVGLWLSGDGDGWIEIRRNGDEVIGIIAGSPNKKEGDPPRLDDKNPDPEQRGRELDGVTIMQGFKYDGDDHWSGGTIYDPDSGNTYKGKLTLIDANTLKLRGYIGISLFGRSDTWTRTSK